MPSKFGLPDNFKQYGPYPFGGMNVYDSPLAIEDAEFTYLENFVRTGNGYLRTLWDAGTAIYTAPINLSIISHKFYTIGSNYYVIVFLSDGTAVQVAVPPTGTGATTQITSTTGTFYLASSGYIPAVSQWGTQFIVISNRNTLNDYWVWDGSTLYGAGTLAPTSLNNPVLLSSGSNYNAQPTVTIYGGQGSGAVATAYIQNGAVVDLQVTNPGTGYAPGDIVQAQFSGGGSDTAAILTAALVTGGIAAIEVTAGGSGYTSAPTVAIGGSGEVTSVAITNNGGQYHLATVTVSFSGGGGTGAAGIVNTQNAGFYYRVVGVTMTSGGTGYTSAPTVTFETSPFGYTATGTAAISGGAAAVATVSGGAVTAISVTSSGHGYTVAPSVTLSGGAGTGATAAALLQGGSVGSVTVTDAGSGYTSPPLLKLVGGGGSGATAAAVLTPTPLQLINVTAAGSGYTAAPTVAITSGDGNGSGATAQAVISSGSVIAIQLLTPGSGYTSVPIVTFSGGTGTGAAAVAQLVPTTIASAYVSNSGLGYTSAPAVEVEPGANNAAAATFELMPFGVSGSCLETFNSRLWVFDPAPPLYGTLPPGGNFSYSAADSFTDFATSDGGGEFTNSDRFLLTRYVGARQSNGYLYAFGDGSVSVISNVQTTGSPATTTFTYQNVDPQAGLSFRDTIQDFGRAVPFLNTTGVYGLYGGNVTKISEKLDRLFLNAIFPPTTNAVTPSAATATIFDIKHYVCLLTMLDPDLGTYRNVMVAWNEKGWFVASQTPGLTFVSEQKVNSDFTAWGTDGSKLFPLFQTPSATLTKRFDTKFYGNDAPFLIKDLWSVHLIAQDLSASLSGVAGSMTLVTSGPAQQESQFPQAMSGVYAEIPLGVLSFQAPPPYWPTWTSGTQGLAFNLLQARFSTTSPDFVLGNFVLGYAPVSFTN